MSIKQQIFRLFTLLPPFCGSRHEDPFQASHIPSKFHKHGSSFLNTRGLCLRSNWDC